MGGIPSDEQAAFAVFVTHQGIASRPSAHMDDVVLKWDWPQASEGFKHPGQIDILRSLPGFKLNAHVEQVDAVDGDQKAAQFRIDQPTLPGTSL